jgi:hypothetical protein
VKNNKNTRKGQTPSRGGRRSKQRQKTPLVTAESGKNNKTQCQTHSHERGRQAGKQQASLVIAEYTRKMINSKNASTEALKYIRTPKIQTHLQKGARYTGKHQASHKLHKFNSAPIKKASWRKKGKKGRLFITVY